MMNDRELLELAAKAASIAGAIDPVETIFIRDADDVYGVSVWMPLDDDGDALRLAVKLGICIDTSDGVHVQYIVDGCSHPITEYEFYDIYAATRRAIVRAAAEIGKAMP